MRILLENATERQLDWLITHIRYEINGDVIWKNFNSECRYSSEWSAGGPIIEEECIEISCIHTTGWTPNTWTARHPKRFSAKGATPLVAAMRCYVASKLCGAVWLPEELK